MHAALIFERCPYTVGRRHRPFSAECNLKVFYAAELSHVLAHDLSGPPAFFGVPGIHTQQVARKKRCLFAAGACFDFHDRIAGIVGITRDQRCTQLFFQLRQLRLQPGGFRGEAFILGGKLLCRFKVACNAPVLLIYGDDLCQLGVAPAELTYLIRIRCHLRSAHLLLNIMVLIQCQLCCRKIFNLCHSYIPYLILCGIL